jgi:deazaflavin-dependent oxidoreductase (nitroreductase family)
VGKYDELNTRVIAEFRANAGEALGRYEGTPLLLLHTTGWKTGAARTNPLVYLRDGDRLLVFGTNAGATSHPHWYANLMAEPHVTVEVGVERFNAVARTATGDERQQLWDMAVSTWAVFADYQRTAEREIPVVVLEPVPGGRPPS